MISKEITKIFDLLPRKGRYLFISLVLIFVNQAYSQDYKSVNISLPEGLSQSSVYTIAQDKTGFIWAGTQDGLNKFDGSNFTTFYNQPFDTTSISSAYINCILNDSRDRTWIGTMNGGLNLMIKPKESFLRFNKSAALLSDNTIKCLYENSKGDILAGTNNGITVIHATENINGISGLSFENLKTDTSNKLEWVTAICEKDPAHYWVSSSTGLHLVEYSKNSFKIILDYNSDNGFCSNQVTSIIKDKQGNFWTATQAGIAVINSDNKAVRFIHFSEKPSMSDMIYAICFSSDGSLWAASGEGLIHIGSNDVDSILIKEPRSVKVLSSDRSLSGALLSITEDKINKGLIWIGSESNGLIKLVPVSKKFNTNHLDSILKTSFVFSLLKDHKNIVWIGTTSGLIRYDRITNRYSVFKHDNSKPFSLPYDYINTVTELPDSSLLIGCPMGLCKIENPYKEQPSFRPITVNPISPKAPVRQICVSGNNIYLVLPWRIFKYNALNGTAAEFIRLNDSISKNYSDFRFNWLAVDHSENIWIAGTNGLFLYRKIQSGYDTAKPEIFYHEMSDTNSLRCHMIHSVTVSSAGEVWISTANGFSKVINENGKISFKNYSSINGLKNNAVYGAIENPIDHTLWLSTNGGLTNFNPSKNTFTNYDVNDGLQSNEFNGGSFYRANDNEFFFGGVNGYTSFYPKDIIPDGQPPLTYITSFILPGSEINLDPLGEKKIELKHDQNSFSIDFIALHYVNPGKNTYEYMLEGYQKEWTKAGNIHRVNFSQLPAGEYVFKVKGSNNDGISGNQVDSLKIIIKPPFWQTIWFYILMAAIVLLFFVVLHLYRLRLKMDQVKERDKIRKEIASDFHDELGHKLTTISWFSEILKNKLRPEEKDLHNYLTKINDTSGSLYHTMKDLLWAMDPAKDSVSDLYLQIKEFGQSLFDQTGVEFTAKEAPQGLKEENIPLAYKRHVLLIFKEAMHNSFKHSKCNRVFLDVQRENNHVTIILKDNGKGFDIEPEIKGNGLKNVEKRSKLINGKILIQSGKEGTCINLEIPLAN